MKRLHFDYQMQINYTEEVKKCHFTLKCVPAETKRQKPEDIKIEITPEDILSNGEDSFGNKVLYGSIDREHNYFGFHVTGNVTAGLMEYEPLENEASVGKYKYSSALTTAGDGLKYYYDSLGLGNDIQEYEKAVFMMHRLYQDFRYEKNVTDFSTTAEEAWKLGCGVCQDYAHILITLCRLAGIPARYVAGMLIGEGYSHAWVEVLTGGRWYALDPTNDIIVTDSHIKIGVGRDASDCMINRGLVIGGGSQIQEIHVSVEEI